MADRFGLATSWGYSQGAEGPCCPRLFCPQGRQGRMIKTPGSLQDLTQRISGRGKAGAVGVGGVGPDDLVRVESLPAALGRINLAVKRAGERSAGNRHAPFDVAGAGNGISHGFTAPVLDPTLQGLTFCPPPQPASKQELGSIPLLFPHPWISQLLSSPGMPGTI